MLESLITISLVGLAAGIIFSMPIAGPVSILITSHALRGHLRYCIKAALGAAIIDWVICFIAVHGFTRIFGFIVNYVPYILCIGAIVLFIIGLKIVKARFDFNHFDVEKPESLKRVRKVNQKNGFWTGLFVNVSNPSLFFGWLTSSAIVMSIVSTLGLNVGGIDNVVGNNMVIVKSFAGSHSVAKDMIKPAKVPRIVEEKAPKFQRRTDAPVVTSSKLYQWLFSLSYAFFVAVGTLVWFVSFSYILVRNRTKLKMEHISRVIHGMGIFLCIFAVYLLGSAMGFFVL
jgi:threonine/homoserine/homoserine lactone efflux protein